MIPYLFKSTLCLLVLWGIYKLLLESEKFHVFNRFYLLLSLVLAFAAPLINIEIPSSENKLVLFQNNINAQPIILQETIEAIKPMPATSNWEAYLVTISGLVSFVLLIRFIKNIATIIKQIRQNSTVEWHGAKLVLLDKPILPYTFLNYVFISKAFYYSASIEPELFSHELAHVRQKHSLDVLFLELLRTIFWFNPLLSLWKQAIQLNHEFLADEAVNKTYNDITAYQYLLLSKASQAGGLSLTSNLNFQITKKRLLMMTKITPQSTAFIKKATCISLFVALAFCLADFRLMAQEVKTVKLSAPTVTLALKPHKLTKEDVNYKKGRFLLTEKDGKRYDKNYNQLTAEEKNMDMKLMYFEKSVPTQEEMDKWLDSKIYGVWIDDKRVANSKLSQYKYTDISNFFISKLAKNTVNYGKHYYQVDLMTNDYYNNVYIKEVIEKPIFFIDKRREKN